MVMATTAATMAVTPAMTTLSGCIRCVDVLCGLPALHLGALHIGRRMFLGHGGDEAAYGGFGARSRR
jgi:hypothetical protein